MLKFSFMRRHLAFPLFLLFTLSIFGCAHIQPKPTFDAEAAGSAYYHFSMADQAIMQGDIPRGITELQAAIKADPESAILRVHLASLFLATGNLDSARSSLEEALRYNPDHIIAHKVLGGLCLSENKLDCAEKHYRAILSVEPKNRDAIKYLVFTLTQQGRINEALDTLERYISYYPNDINVHFELVEIYLTMNEKNKALDVLNKIVKAYPRNPEVFLARATLLEDMGKLQEAKKDYEQAISLEPDNHDARGQLMKLCLDIHDYQCAKEEIEQMKQGGADEFLVGIYEGLYLFSTREYLKAAAIYEGLHKKNPMDEHITLMLGLALKNARKFDEAEGVFKSIPKESQYSLEAVLGLAEICVERKNACAIEYAEQAKQINPDDYQAYLVVGSYYIKLEDYQKAEVALKEAESKKSDSIDVIYTLGVLYDKMGKWETGVEVAKRILELNPDDPDALNFIGYSYADHAVNLDEAEKMLTKAVQSRPNDGYIIDSLGWCYFKQGKYDKAKELIEKAAELSPHEPTIWEHLGELHAVLGNRKKAKESFLKALELNPDAQQKNRIEKRLNEVSR